jgi:competence protein ComEA
MTNESSPAEPALPTPPIDDRAGTSSERRSLAVLLAAVGGYLIIAAFSRGCSGRSIEVDRSDERLGDLRLDLNGASWAELLQLPGLGPALAERILAYREANGPFQSVEELDNVKGIGPKLLDRIWPFVYVDLADGGERGAEDSHDFNGGDG